MRKALITGINGQDGSYLSEFLLSKGYEVTGIVRNASDGGSELCRIEAIRDRLALFSEDISNINGVTKVIRNVQPDEIYNLASQSRIDVSFDKPVETVRINAIGALNVFEAARLHGSRLHHLRARP